MDQNPAAGSGPSNTLLIPDTSAAPSNGENNTRVEGGIESPTTPSSANTLARFEFETGRGNEGSKILMVEWDCSHADGRELCANDREGWVVLWEGKSAAYPLHDDNDKGPSSVLRVYFLLPENAPIPPAVTISHPRTGRTLTTKCMPAIFAPGLGADPPDPGKRGVLHTIWAKLRLLELQDEITKEMQANSEGVTLEMAIQEKQWVMDHFGFADPDAQQHPVPPTPQSPRSPVGGRLGEMLRGLKLSTSPTDLARTPGTTPRQTSQSFPLSALKTVSVPNPTIPKPGSGAAVASLDAVIGNGQPVVPVSQTRDTADELFALPMSPRSPEMKTSPFSFLK
ncbi:hypothetical protein SAMD00023353_0100890 [Rosellinia necatrix]|uniref:Uncharacterized protein n=1 Tax=Rosellinia necatrix TaxID=77044 RepID=A0A1S7UHD9_ROSNE|nr:hypothetical protein SAMD00023353_0100890 [Rosellinia necatrix]